MLPACINFFQLLQLDLQGSSSAPKRLCSARAVTVTPARQFPGEALPLEPRRRSPVWCPEAVLQLIVAAQVLGACGGLRDTAYALWDLLVYVNRGTLLQTPESLSPVIGD